MNETDSIEDSELLRRYAAEGSEAAFAELVRRRIGLVYSVALRQTHGDRHRAEDATQAVFTDLARKAKALADRPVLAGWLYRSAQFAAAGLVRAERRRAARELEAHLMEKDSAPDTPATDWEKFRPVLDDALNEIDEGDRDAIVLRYFDGRPFAEIGGRLRLTENAARMRVDRALDRLQSVLARRGVTSTTAAIGLALGQQIAAAAPAGLAASVTGAALAQGAAGAGVVATIMGMTKLQIAIVGAVALSGVSLYVMQARSNADLRAEIAALKSTQPSLETLRAENQKLASTAAEAETLRAEDADFKQLEKQIADARKAQQDAARVARATQATLSEEQIKAEIERLNKEGNALVNEYKGLMERSHDANLGADVRAQTVVAAQAKLEAIKAKQQQIREFIGQAKAMNPDYAFTAPEVQRIEDGSSPRRDPNASDVKLTLGLTGADYETALTNYENIANVKIVRDPSLTNATGTADLQFGTAPRNQIMDRMRAALRQQWNIVLERAPDGSLVAKRAGNP